MGRRSHAEKGMKENSKQGTKTDPRYLSRPDVARTPDKSATAGANKIRIWPTGLEAVEKEVSEAFYREIQVA
jgi:hypothetical protein